MSDFNHVYSQGAGVFKHEDFVAPGSSYDTDVLNTRVLHSRTGATTPRYREKARNGTLPMLPLDYNYTVINGGKGHRIIVQSAPASPTGTIQSDGGDWGVAGSGIWGTKVGIERLSAGEKSDIDALATTRVLNKIKNQKVNWPQDFGERAQTVALITTNVKRLALAFVAFKAGQLGKAVSILGSAQPSRRFRKKYTRLIKPSFKRGPKQKRYITSVAAKAGGGSVFSPRNLAQLWLEFQYGWRPLVNSVQGTIETFQETLEQGKLVKVQSYYLQRYERSTNSTTNFNSQNRAHHVNTTKGSHKVAYTIYYKLVNSGNHNLAATGFSNPLNLGWELIPFSFVVDWFVNIGNYLSSLDATLGLVFEKGCKTTATRSSSVKTTTFECDYSYQEHTGSVVSDRQDFTLKREVLTDFPSPSRPVLKGWNLGIQRYVTAAALLTVVTAGIKGQTLYRMR